MPTYFIPAPRLAEFQGRAAEIAKKAKKLDLAPVTATLTGNEKVEEHKFKMVDERGNYIRDEKGEVKIGTQLRKFVEVEVTGNPVILPGGWRFAATLQRLEGEVIVAGAPDLKIPMEFRDAARVDSCDHCQTIRRRKDTYLLLNEAGEFKVVGTNCLVDFLHARNAETLASMFEEWREFVAEISESSEDEGAWGGGGRGTQFFKALEVLEFAQQDVLDRGYWSRAKAEENNTLPTGVAVITLGISPSPFAKDSDLIHPTKKAKELAAQVLAWGMDRFASKEVEQLDSEYERNLRAALKASALEYRQVGLIASLVPSYHRFIEGERLRKAGQASQHVGVEGQRIEMTLTLQKVITYESMYGVGYIYKFTDVEGNVFVWFSSSSPQRPTGEMYEFEGKMLPEWKPWQEGQTSLVRGTIKKHDVYHANGDARSTGVKQTILSRVSAIVPAAPKKPRAKKESKKNA